MTNLSKGSALPRSLSESASIYLAPTIANGTDQITVAIRQGPQILYLADHSLGDIENWAVALPDRAENILQQLSFAQNYRSVAGLKAQAGPLIMGIVNVTPDSFSDGGDFLEAEKAVSHAETLIAEGAHILDFGGESTRPGANGVSTSDEIGRVVPVIQKCRALSPNLSIDTRKPAVMAAAIEAGASLINDVSALEYDAGSLQVAATSGLPICLMHSSADPKVMQDNPVYDHVLFDVIDYLRQRMTLCLDAGILRENIILDPGIGFGKTLAHNLILLKGLRFFHALGCPVLLGVSRKSFIGKLDEAPAAKDRVAGSLAAMVAGLEAGVQVFRVHDVAATRQAIAIWRAIDDTALT